jgi:hypothetical protein
MPHPTTPDAVDRKEYLGDGAYVQFDGNGLILTTEDGISITNKIYLEAEVWEALKEFAESLRR